jgi:hypothetical protein
MEMKIIWNEPKCMGLHTLCPITKPCSLSHTGNMDRISDETIKEFQELVLNKYGQNITIDEASEILRDLTDYFFTLHLIDSRIAE